MDPEGHRDSRPNSPQGFPRDPDQNYSRTPPEGPVPDEPSRREPRPYSSQGPGSAADDHVYDDVSQGSGNTRGSSPRPGWPPQVPGQAYGRYYGHDLERDDVQGISQRSSRQSASRPRLVFNNCNFHIGENSSSAPSRIFNNGPVEAPSMGIPALSALENLYAAGLLPSRAIHHSSTVDIGSTRCYHLHYHRHCYWCR